MMTDTLPLNLDNDVSFSYCRAEKLYASSAATACPVRIE